MIVRPSTSQDHHTLARIARSCGTTLDFAKEQARSYGHVWVATDGAEPIAFLLAWTAGDELEILDVCTDPAFRRRGAARELLGHAIRQARARGLSGLCLEVRVSNAPARSLYAHAGFREVGERTGYYQDTGEDAHLLRLDLSGSAQAHESRISETPAESGALSGAGA